MFRKTIYADNIYQNSDVCKFLEQCCLDFVMTFRKIRAMAEVQKIVEIFETNEFSKSENTLFTVLQIQAKKDKLAQIDYSHGRQKLAKLKEITKSLLFLQIMSQLCQAIFYNKILEILSYYSRFPHLCNNWIAYSFTESVHRYILCTHSFLQLQAKKHNLKVDFVFLLIFAIPPNTHAELKQRKTTVEIRKFKFKQVFNAISKFQPNKTRLNML
ncbi:Hypothetical_protein [Hexamita inflata]|uniref:Hypothetical_protein n=1 Tax=Hexamita inflata TaxID=28002 RepID=A0AA86UIP6_9EUKA|nr:Hypothetical protein HINF_LOCUS40367 [Hexamita inflata]